MIDEEIFRKVWNEKPKLSERTSAYETVKWILKRYLEELEKGGSVSNIESTLNFKKNRGFGFEG